MQKFMVNYTISGRACQTFEAESIESLRAKIDAEVERDDFDIDMDDIDAVDFDIKDLHPVTRDGREVWTTYVGQGDIRGHQSAIDDSPLFAASP